MVTCNDIHNCVDYFMCYDCPAKKWMWNRIGRGSIKKEDKNMIRKDILDTAETYICSQREAEYGTPEDNFKSIAELWSYWLGVEIYAHDVAVMMALLKVARLKTGQPKEDTYIDACGYMAIAAEIALGKYVNQEDK